MQDRDRAPKSGCVFLVAESTNADGLGSWTETFDSLHRARKFYTRIEESAVLFGGLFPGLGVREVTEEEAERVLSVAEEEFADLATA